MTLAFAASTVPPAHPAYLPKLVACTLDISTPMQVHQQPAAAVAGNALGCAGERGHTSNHLTCDLLRSVWVCVRGGGGGRTRCVLSSLLNSIMPVLSRTVVTAAPHQERVGRTVQVS